MAGNKLQTLEHLDGKQVRFSTITSQYPELFIKRKRNTGELIISTDIDTRYGMHHIYAGGEHIASGYGFANIKTRNDLTYIQETYTGLYNHFNSGYIYHNNAYGFIASYVYNSYNFLNNEIYKNSFKNVSVDYSKNMIETNNGIYILNVLDGQLSFSKESEKFISLNESGTYFLKQDFFEYNRTDEYPKSIDNKYVITTLSATINKQMFLNKIDDIHFEYSSGGGNLGYIPVTNGNSSTTYFWTNGNVGEITKTYITNVVKNSAFDNINVYFDIPVMHNANAYFSCKITDKLKNIHCDTVQFNWVKPILYGCFNELEINNESFNEENTYSFKNFYRNYNDDLSVTNLRNDVFSNTYSIFLIPRTNEPFLTNVQPLFYISSNLSEKENNEGGFIFSEYMDSSPIIKLADSPNYETTLKNNYNIYVSDKQTINVTLRFDIDYKKS